MSTENKELSVQCQICSLCELLCDKMLSKVGVTCTSQSQRSNCLSLKIIVFADNKLVTKNAGF